jgi:hypothetical protein
MFQRPGYQFFDHQTGNISKDILASPYWLLIPILAYPLDFWQKIFAAGMAQSVEHTG